MEPWAVLTVTAIACGVIVAAVAVQRTSRFLTAILLGVGTAAATLLMAVGIWLFVGVATWTNYEAGEGQILILFGFVALVLGIVGLLLCLRRLRR